MAEQRVTGGLKVLLIGSGGREHAIAWKLAQSVLVSDIFVIPGNGGTVGPKTQNISLPTGITLNYFPWLLEKAISLDIDLMIPGPEEPLVNGIVDHFRRHGPAKIACFGPSRSAARMEGSKVFAKDFMHRNSIPTARYDRFDTLTKAKEFLNANQNFQWVIKADGLAGGKGVIIPKTHAEAVTALEQIMDARLFGEAGTQVVIEEFLEGEEISILSFTDGYTVRSLPPTQDHKRVNDHDEGKNTGGMGAYAPAAVATPEIMARIEREVLQPTIDGMRNEDFPMVGCLFTGLVLTKDGPKVLEYNVRFGDPEIQTLLPLLENDLAEIMVACTGRTLSRHDLIVRELFSTCVVVAAAGYPDNYPKGLQMTIKNTAKDTYIFHAGTTIDDSNTLRTSGGRVIATTALGSSVSDAVAKAYTGIESIHFDRMHYRRDIAYRELQRNQTLRDPDRERNALSYAAAGVSINAGNELVKRIQKFACVGGFGGTLSLKDAGFGPDAPDIISSIDGIGTKLFIAQEIQDYSTIGVDLVAMNVNDLVVQGAKPLMFLDYYGCGTLDVDDAESFVKGVDNGCAQAGCILAGGETAEMPGLYHGKDFDAAGCAIGAVKGDRMLLPDTELMEPGDILLGLASTGVHSNGFSLVREVVRRAGMNYSDIAPFDIDGRTLGAALLTPTKIYVKMLLDVLDSDVGSAILGLAHITGGGLVENIPRALPDSLAARIDKKAWRRPEVFKWLQREGNIAEHEMLRTFNCGIGMVVVCKKSMAGSVKRAFTEVDPSTWVYQIGKLEARNDEAVKWI